MTGFKSKRQMAQERTNVTKEALKLALEALTIQLENSNGEQKYSDAIEALAQPVQHREGYWCADLTCSKCYSADFRLRHTTTSLPVQKPVAWITPDGEGFRIRFSPPTSEVPLGWDALYTAPPQRPWVGLTDDEISALSKGHMTRNGFARNIEQALKAKNT